MLESIKSVGIFSVDQKMVTIVNRKALNRAPPFTRTSASTPSGQGLFPSLLFLSAWYSSLSLSRSSNESFIGRCSISSTMLRSTSVWWFRCSLECSSYLSLISSDVISRTPPLYLTGCEFFFSFLDHTLHFMWHKIRDGSFLVNIALLVKLFSETTGFSLLWCVLHAFLFSFLSLINFCISSSWSSNQSFETTFFLPNAWSAASWRSSLRSSQSVCTQVVFHSKSVQVLPFFHWSRQY